MRSGVLTVCIPTGYPSVRVQRVGPVDVRFLSRLSTETDAGCRRLPGDAGADGGIDGSECPGVRRVMWSHPMSAQSLPFDRARCRLEIAPVRHRHGPLSRVAEA